MPWNPFAKQQQGQGLNLGGADPNAQYQMPQVPWASNPMITTAALGLLGGRTLNEGLQNVAQNAPAGLAAKTAMQRDMYSIQEKATTKAEADAEMARKRAAMNVALKLKSGIALTSLTPAEQAAWAAAPDVALELGKPQVVGKDSQIWDPLNNTWTTPPGGGAPDPASVANVTQIRKDLEDEPGHIRYRTAAPVLSSMAQSVNDPTSMADLDFVYGMAKIFDPGSVVRETEMGMVIDSQSMPATIKGNLEKILNGEAVLQPQARLDLVKAAATRVNEYRKQAEQEEQFFTDISTRNKINPLDVVRPLEPLASVPGVYTWTPEGGLVAAP
jgi:hypothetical protein